MTQPDKLPVNNRYTYKRPDGLIRSEFKFSSPREVKIALCEGRPLIYWAILFFAGMESG